MHTFQVSREKVVMKTSHIEKKKRRRTHEGNENRK